MIAPATKLAPTAEQDSAPAASLAERVASSSSLEALAPPASTDPRKLHSASAVRAALAELDVYSSTLDAQLERLLASSASRRRTAHRALAALAPQVELLLAEATVLRGRLGDASDTATRLSSSVRSLDQQRDKIALANAWADRAQDLRASLLSLHSAVEQQDWDQATRHCVRAMSIDADVLNSRFAASVVPTTELPEPPPTTLLNLRRALLSIYTRRFQMAIEAKDQVEATRFFKMLPVVGWKDEGLAVYCNFARSLVREKGKGIGEALVSTRNPSPQHHSLLLTAIFEHLAVVIDQHQGIVDRYYGAAEFARGVLPGLQEECDRLGRRVVDHWWEDRGVDRKVSDARTTTFTYAATLGTAASRANTRFPGGATNRAMPFSLPGRPSTPMGSGASTPIGGASGAAATTTPASDAAGPDGREIDRLLFEQAGMASTWGTYRRFVHGRLAEREPSEDGEDETSGDGSAPVSAQPQVEREGARGPSSTLAGREASAVTESLPSESLPAHMRVLQASTLGQHLAQMLERAYMPLETWYVRSSVEKAHQLDTMDLEARPYTSSVLDDVFYVVRSVLSRSLSTASARVVSHTVNNLRWIFEEEYVQALVRRMEGLWRSVGASMGVDGPRKEAATKEMRTTFVVYLNVLSSSAEYMQRLLNELANDANVAKYFDGEEVAAVSTMLLSLSGLPTRIRSAIRVQMDVLFNNLIRPRLRAVLSDCYRDVHYVLDEDRFAEAEYQDEVRRRFVRGWETVLAGYRDIFDARNWEAYFSLAVDAVVQPWEKVAMSLQYTELGALRFDKDIRSVAAYLSQHTASGNVRDHFTRLQQLSYVLNYDEEEEGEEDEGQDGVRDDGRLSGAPLSGRRAPGQNQGEKSGDGAAAAAAAATAPGARRSERGGEEALYESAAASGVVWALSANEVRSVRALKLPE